MQNPEDRAREPLSHKSEAPDRTLDLGWRICARYGSSPGVISTGSGPGLARQVFQFSERLPLLQTLHQRWKTDGVMSAGPTGPLWLRAMASQKSKKPGTRVAARVVAPSNTPEVRPSTELSAPDVIRPQQLGSDLTAEGHLRREITSHPEAQLHSDGLSTAETSRVSQESRNSERADAAPTSDATVQSGDTVSLRSADADVPASASAEVAAPTNAVHSMIATADSQVAHREMTVQRTEDAVAPTVAVTGRDEHAFQAPISEMTYRSGDAVPSDSRMGPDGVPKIPVRSNGGAIGGNALRPNATVQLEEATTVSKDAARPGDKYVVQAPRAEMASRSRDSAISDKSQTYSPMLQAAKSARAVIREESTQSASLQLKGMTHDSGDNLRGVQFQRAVGSKDGNETGVAGLMPGISNSAPQKAITPATGEGRKSSEAARGHRPDASASTLVQMGPPIFLRQAGGAHSRVNRQNAVAPEKSKASDVSAYVLPTKSSEHASLTTTRLSSREVDASVRPPTARETATGNMPRSETVQVSRSKASEEVTRTPVLQRTPLADNARKPALQGGRSVSNSVSSPAKVGSEESDPGMSLRLSQLPDQPDSAKPIVAAEHLTASENASASPPYVQRKATMPASHTSKHWEPGNATADTVLMRGVHVATSSLTPEGGALVSSTVPKASAMIHQPDSGKLSAPGDGGANFVQRYPKSMDTIANSSPTASPIGTRQAPVIHPHALQATPPSEPVGLANRRIQTKVVDAGVSIGGSNDVTAPADEARRVQAIEKVTAPIEASTSGRLIVARQRAVADEALNHRPNNLKAEQFRGQPQSSVTAGTMPLLQAAIHNDNPHAVSSPISLLSAPKSLAKSEVTHRAWRRADEASRHANQAVTPSRANNNIAQRSTVGSAGTNDQSAPGQPSLPSQGNQMPQSLPPGDIAQLANRVYDLIVRRLATEKQRKGL